MERLRVSISCWCQSVIEIIKELKLIRNDSLILLAIDMEKRRINHIQVFLKHSWNDKKIKEQRLFEIGSASDEESSENESDLGEHERPD
ncbi:hypothetical protein Tsubulata_032610, partial [Turnera subulata]